MASLLGNIIRKTRLNNILDDKEKKKIKFSGKVSEYLSLHGILTHLADLSAKDREEFLHPWKTAKAAKGLGREKSSETLTVEDLFRYEKVKLFHEHNLGKKISDKKYIEYLYKDELSKLKGKEVDTAYGEIKTFLNKISALRTMLKKLSR